MNMSSLFDGKPAYTLTFCCLTLFYSLSASAVLVDGSVLSFLPAPGSPSSTQPAPGAGSWFTIEPTVFSNYVSLTS